MRAAILPVLALLALGTQAAMPLTVETCKTMKTEAMRQQCMLSAVDAPPSITGKTYSTRDVPRRGPDMIDQSAPPLQVVPYVNVTPGQKASGMR